MKSTQHFKKNKKGLECLNCGQPLHETDNFCSECGQKNIDRISITELVSNFFSGFFAFDNQFFRTLKPLLFKPGKVAKDYVSGIRKRYTNPFVFLLHTTILYFILNGLLSFFLIDHNKELLKEKQAYETQQQINQFFNKDGRIAFFKDSLHSKLEKENKLKELIYQIKNALSIDSIEMGNNTFITIKDYSKNKIKKKINKSFYDFNINYVVSIENKDSVMLYQEASIDYDTITRKINKMDKYVRHFPYKPTIDALRALNLEPTFVNIFLYKKLNKFNTFSTNLDEGLFQKSFISKVPMGLFILLPLLALGFSILYIRHAYKYTEHLIFVFYLQASFFWIILAFAIIETIFKSVFEENGIYSLIISSISFVLFLIVIFKSLRHFYQQRFIKTLLKFILLSFFYLVVGILGASAIATLALFA